MKGTKLRTLKYLREEVARRLQGLEALSNEPEGKGLTEYGEGALAAYQQINSELERYQPWRKTGEEEPEEGPRTLFYDGEYEWFGYKLDGEYFTDGYIQVPKSSITHWRSIELPEGEK